MCALVNICMSVTIRQHVTRMQNVHLYHKGMKIRYTAQVKRERKGGGGGGGEREVGR